MAFSKPVGFTVSMPFMCKPLKQLKLRLIPAGTLWMVRKQVVMQHKGTEQRLSQKYWVSDAGVAFCPDVLPNTQPVALEHSNTFRSVLNIFALCSHVSWIE